jgi:hypothetical protein
MESDRSFFSVESVLANKWLLNSGIQNDDGPSRGGFNSWFDLERQDYSYVYSEITGYGITSLLYLSRYFGKEFYMEKALSAYKWLSETAMDKSGGVRTRDYLIDMDDSEHYSFNSGNIYTFDNGMVLYGLVNLYRKTAIESILRSAVRIADFLIDNIRKKDGSFFAVYNSDTGEKIDVTDKWSTQTGSYHSKLALGFIDLYDVTKDGKYKNIVISLCEGALKFQDDSGRFITNCGDNSTHLHPHLYSAEGLLYAGDYFGMERFIDSARKAVNWVLSSIKDDGGVPKKFTGTEFVPYYRSDILAQTLRLGSIFFGMGKSGEGGQEVLSKLRKCLVRFQYNRGNRQDGGFYYGFTLDGNKKDHLNSWCTMFALQALMTYDEIVVKRQEKNMECFV